MSRPTTPPVGSVSGSPSLPTGAWSTRRHTSPDILSHVWANVGPLGQNCAEVENTSRPGAQGQAARFLAQPADLGRVNVNVKDGSSTGEPEALGQR